MGTQLILRQTPKAHEALKLGLVDEPVAFMVGNAQARYHTTYLCKWERGWLNRRCKFKGLTQMRPKVFNSLDAGTRASLVALHFNRCLQKQARSSWIKHGLRFISVGRSQKVSVTYSGGRSVAQEYSPESWSIV